MCGGCAERRKDGHEDHRQVGHRGSPDRRDLWGGVHLPLSGPAEAHGTCADHQYRTYDGTHDSDGDGVGCEGKPEPPNRRSSSGSSGTGSSSAGASGTSGHTQTASSGYDRDNWDYDSRSARARLGCNSSEHVDHIVALKEAYDSGAASWSGARKSQFANDPLNQWCLAAGVNISKSDGDLAEWRGGSCGQRKYIATVTLQVKRRYGLSIDGAEQRAIDSALAASCAAVRPSTTTTAQPPQPATGSATGSTSSGSSSSQIETAVSVDSVRGRIVARRLADGRTEFGWLPTGSADRVLPQRRYFPATATTDRWLASSAVELAGVEIGRINARLREGGAIEFAFTPVGQARILPSGRYFPSRPTTNRWLHSTELEFGR